MHFFDFLQYVTLFEFIQYAILFELTLNFLNHLFTLFEFINSTHNQKINAKIKIYKETKIIDIKDHFINIILITFTIG